MKTMKKNQIIAFFICSIVVVALIIWIIIHDKSHLLSVLSLLASLPLYKFTLWIIDWISRHFCSIDNLESKYTIEQAKNKVRILWIDDDYKKSEKGRENSITKYANSISRDKDHYDITTKSDTEITEASEYHIVICDYQGIVGKDSQFSNGAEFITALHKRSPGVHIISCSGVSSFNKMTVPCDAFYSKASFKDLETFKNVISNHINYYFDPKQYWKKMLLKLTKLELWSFKLEKKLMKAYCSDYLSGTATNLEKIKAEYKGHKDSNDLAKIIDCCIKYIEL